MLKDGSLEQHNYEIHQNLAAWNQKPLLQAIYHEFHSRLARELSAVRGSTIEIGSGIGKIKDTIPFCITTDLFENPWVDEAQNAYSLSYETGSIANILLFDVFHHLRFPGTALNEFHRVLAPGGRVIIFDPCVSVLGRVVYGLFHHEPLALRQAISWEPNATDAGVSNDYYAAQGNAYRIFFGTEFQQNVRAWSIVTLRRYAELSYVLSGGFSKRQLYPTRFLPLVRVLDRVADLLPALFATRLLVVLEKR